MRVTGPLRRQRPLPLVPADARRIAPGVDVVEDDTDGGVVFLEGMATWCWDAGDEAGRRLAMVGLTDAKAARHREVAAGFGCSETTLWRYRRDCAAGGVAALTPQPKGPRRASKLTPDRVARIRRAREQGLGLQAIADAEGIARSSVIRTLAGAPGADAGDARRVAQDDAAGASADDGVDLSDQPAQEQPAQEEVLTPLARPVPRTVERQAARAGLLAEAAPVITQGAGLPLAGVLTILPALAVTGLLDVADQVYGPAKAAFYGLRSLLLAMALAMALGQPRAEGLRRIDPADLGRLIGPDRAPEPKTLRRRVGELAAQRKADQLLTGLARHHLDTHADAAGIFYVDGHVRAWHGKHDVPKHHLARMRLSMPAEEDTWICDAHGDGVLVWQAPAATSLTGELRQVAKQVRELVGADRRPTICFDRGGYSPKLFAQLHAAKFDILTYRKGAKTLEPDDAFGEYKVTDDRGVEHVYQLADRKVTLTYTDNGRQRTFECRQITRKSSNGHQTQILTTRTDNNPAVIAQLMFTPRGGEENFFRYMRHRFDPDGLDAYATTPDDPNRSVPNPAKRHAKRDVKALAAAIKDAQACHDRHTAAGVPAHASDSHRGLSDEIDDARTRLAQLQTAAQATPDRVPLGQLHPNSRRLDPEHKRICDAVRITTYNAESALARLLSPHWPPARHEARTLLHEIFTTPADIQTIGDQLHVRINPLSAPRRTRALTGLCNDLTATQTRYPGTGLTLVYSVKER